MQIAEGGRKRQGKESRHEGIALFATFSLGDAVRLRASRPDVHRLTRVPKAHKWHQGRSLRDLAQCGQHGLPANSVISRRDVNGQDREVRIGLSLGLQGVHERLRSCPSRVESAYWCGWHAALSCCENC